MASIDDIERDDEDRADYEVGFQDRLNCAAYEGLTDEELFETKRTTVEQMWTRLEEVWRTNRNLGPDGRGVGRQRTNRKKLRAESSSGVPRFQSAFAPKGPAGSYPKFARFIFWRKSSPCISTTTHISCSRERMRSPMRSPSVSSRTAARICPFEPGSTQSGAVFA